ncbi:hypothetical protein ACHAAC_04040 [Aeromicrobium sp. CF4.19]|uniref:hypothetical protein n=1 Tax=Aeromicrobium sp. CF4.19 TaxID=3373082 RepID=UPI003EE60A2D
MSTHTVETSSYPVDEWDERSERVYTGEELRASEAPVLTAAERQRQAYGGVSAGAAFFGWLSALGVVALLAAAAGTIAVLLGLVQGPSDTGNLVVGPTTALTAAIGGTVLLVIGAYSGGYVAGRLVRFDGGRQGVAVWFLVVLAGLFVAGAAVIADAQYAVRERAAFPVVNIPTGDLVLGGAITLGVVLLLTALVAVGGGKVGVRYHAKVDRSALDPATPVEPDETA